MKPRAVFLTLLFIAGALVAGVVSTRADAQTVSPSIAPSKVSVNRELRQGEDIVLPPLTVGMPGNAPATIEINVLHVGDQPELSPERAWFQFEPQRFETTPGRNTIVAVHLNIPREAPPGAYKALLQARAVRDPAAPQGGVGISGAVASTLTFAVRDVNFRPWDPAVEFFRERAPFSYIGAGLILGSVVLYLLSSRYGVDFNVRLRRKR
jgi:hypothetical protein